MKSKIIVLNYMKYVKKDNGTDKPMTKIQFAFAECQESEKYNGVTVIDCYFKGHEAYEKMSKDMLLKPLEAEFDVLTDYYNPLATKKILKSINGIELR